MEVRDLPEEPGARSPFSEDVPLGARQEAKVQLVVAPDAEIGLHQFRIHTPLGTSKLAVLDVGALPEIQEAEPNNSPGEGQAVNLPATIVGTISSPGDVDSYKFTGKAGQEVVLQVVASAVGSQLLAVLSLQDSAGHELARVGDFFRRPDPVLTFKLPADGSYTMSVSDLRLGGSGNHFYRLNAGALPYVSGVFPLSVRGGQSSEVEISGSDLGGLRKTTVQAPSPKTQWQTLPVRVKTSLGESLNKVQLAVTEELEIVETEPNNDPAHAQRLTLPVTVNGHVSGGAKGTPDQDYFRFSAKRGQHLSVDVAAARLGSPLDSSLDVLDAEGHDIPRARLRSVLEHPLRLASFPKQPGFYIPERAGFQTNDYLMIGHELVQITGVPDQPDMVLLVKNYKGERIGMLNTSAEAHDVATPAYKVEILKPDSRFSPNGLPVVDLTYHNDDGGPGYGPDSRLDFVAPKDGEYLVRVGDARGLQGDNFSYALTVREARPDFTLAADPANPNVPLGGRVPVTVTANRISGYEGPIEVEVKNLPKGLSASPAVIGAGQGSAVVTVSAGSDRSLLNAAPASFQIVGRAQIEGREVQHDAESGQPLQVVSVTPPPDFQITAEPHEVVLEAGKRTTVTLQVNRESGFRGQVFCEVLNLPPGVRVADIGATGLVFPEGESTRKSILVADDWAGNLDQSIYIVGSVQTGLATQNASAPQILSAPLVLKLRSKQMATAAVVPARR